MVDNFMISLEFYLQSTFVAFKEELFVQRKGVCIGSCVAPVLSEIFFSQHWLEFGAWPGWAGNKVFRYVDDFLKFFNILPVLTYYDAFYQILDKFQ